MHRLPIPQRCERPYSSKSAKNATPVAVHLVKDARGSALLEFAIVLPLLVVFVVGIYDFSNAFNQKQKIEQAAQEGAIVAGAQPMSDIASSGSSSTASNPDSLQPVVSAIVNSLAGSGVLNQGACQPPFPAPAQAGLTWTYTISGCSSAYASDNLVIAINRGSVSGSAPAAVCTVVTVTYPYHWRLFGSVIQLLVPGPNGYSTPTQVTDSATVHNQM
ncbi:MAG: TadE/TadG family type IV pilus assembly protein [Terriglobales bacterium]